MANYSDNNVFMIYGFEKNGKSDQEEIARDAISNGSIMKCPVLAEDAGMAVALFTEKYPELMVAGIVNLADMKREVQFLSDFLKEIPN